MATLPDSIKAWQAELVTLTAGHDAKYEKLKQYRKEVKDLDIVRRQAEKVMTPEQSNSRSANRGAEFVVRVSSRAEMCDPVAQIRQ